MHCCHGNTEAFINYEGIVVRTGRSHAWGRNCLLRWSRDICRVELRPLVFDDYHTLCSLWKEERRGRRGRRRGKGGGEERKERKISRKERKEGGKRERESKGGIIDVLCK